MKTKIALLALCTCAAGTAQAQSTDRLIDRTESRLDRVLDREPKAVLALDGGAAPPWTLALDIPFTWNSNIANSETGRTDAFHTDPSVTLGREWDLGGAVFSVEAGADSDVYLEHDEANSSTVYGDARLTVGNAKGGVAGYLDYTMLGIFDGVFDDHAVTLHHVSVGAVTVRPIGAQSTVTLDANVLRREASIREVEQTRASLSAKFKFQADERTAWVAGLKGQHAMYTGGLSEGRDDTSIRASVGVSHDLSPNASIALSAKFDRNWSNAAGKDYSAWDIGPSLSFSTSF